ncbi:MAG TPA: prepilin peptidase [archaeon]|nr:prepilin peptidase [archaeon]
MFEILLTAIALVGTASAGWVDFKTSDIPDRIVASMIALAFVFHSAEFYLTGSAGNLQSAFFYFVIFGIFSFAMYFGKAWGGGDGALLTAVSVLLPGAPFGSSSFSFPLIYLFSVFFVGIFYSVFYMLWKINSVAGVRKTFFLDFKGVSFISTTTFLSIISFIIFVFTQNIFVLPFALGFAFPILEKLQKLSEKIFKKKISTKNLRVDDMLGQDLPALKIKRLLRGLTEKEVALIKKKMKFVVITDGVRFGPVFFFALVFSLIMQNYLFL